MNGVVPPNADFNPESAPPWKPTTNENDTLVQRLRVAGWPDQTGYVLPTKSLTDEAVTEIEMQATALREAETLLQDVDDHLCDDPHPDDGGSWTVFELRQRIRRYLTHD